MSSIGTIWIWFSGKLTKNIKIFVVFFNVFFILPPVCLSNLVSDLSIDNIVRLGLTNTKIASQDSLKKVLELMAKWKYPTFRDKF